MLLSALTLLTPSTLLFYSLLDYLWIFVIIVYLMMETIHTMTFTITKITMSSAVLCLICYHHLIQIQNNNRIIPASGVWRRIQVQVVWRRHAGTLHPKLKTSSNVIYNQQTNLNPRIEHQCELSKPANTWPEVFGDGSTEQTGNSTGTLLIAACSERCQAACQTTPTLGLFMFSRIFTSHKQKMVSFK